MSALLSKQADVIVVGCGPGGATVARGVARAGKKVVLLDRGNDYDASGKLSRTKTH